MKNIERHNTDDLYKRISSVEQDTAALSADVKNLTHAIEGLITEVRHIKSSSQTNWGTLAAWASVIVVIMIYQNTLSTQPIRDNILETRAEILRMRDWKDITESTIPAIERDLKCLSSQIDIRSSDRYPRKEAEKDIKHIKELIGKHEHTI